MFESSAEKNNGLGAAADDYEQQAEGFKKACQMLSELGRECRNRNLSGQKNLRSFKSSAINQIPDQLNANQ